MDRSNRNRTRVVATALLAALPHAEAAMATPALTAGQLFELCQSTSLREAIAKGDRLGWRRLGEGDVAEWRRGFLRHNGGPVEVAAWRRDEGADSLSFWVAGGPSAHRACAHGTSDPGGLLEAMTARLGEPDSLDRFEFGTSAYWKRGKAQASFSQVGSSATVNLAVYD